MLGKGVPAYSNRYGCLTYCIAGIGKRSGWLRLYPLFSEPIIPSIKPVEEFDVIRTVFRQRRPEPNRPESRKIYPEYIEKVSYVKDHAARAEIFQQYTESGVFLHDGSWRGRKTLGMIKPSSTRFLVTKKDIPMVKFQCGASCPGHTCEIGEFMKFNSVGRVASQNRDQLSKQLSYLSEKELRFVMGTLARHPHRWILISIHVIGAS